MGRAPRSQAPHDPTRRPEDRHGRRHHPARRDQRADPLLRARERGAGLELEARVAELADAEPRPACTIGGVAAHGQRRDDATSCSRTRATPCSARCNGGTHDDATAAIAAAKAAAPGWRELSYDDRAAIFLKAADLLAGPWRDTLNAATMLGQSKTCYQAEIDSACELIDFWRFNVGFGRKLLAEQPISSPGVWNRLDHRPLEGFVYAITPFNFTAIAGNLPTAPALMGNVVALEAGAHPAARGALPDARCSRRPACRRASINMVTGHGVETSEVALSDPDFAGLHFTGSTRVFQQLWREIGENIASYRSYPRMVGETGGKDFVMAHPSADIDVLRTALVRGSFEYQGQKCSASSRAYVPRSMWATLRDDLAATVDGLSMGPTTDFSNFMGAVIDDRAFARVTARDRPRAGRPERDGDRRRHLRRQRGLVHPPDRARVHRPDRGVLHRRVLRAACSRSTSTTTTATTRCSRRWSRSRRTP